MGKNIEPIYKRKWFIAVAVLFFIGALMATFGENDPTQEAENNGEKMAQEEDQEEQIEPDEEAEAVDPMDGLESIDLIEYLVIDTLGEETNMGETRIIEIKIFEEEDELVLDLHGNENLTANMMKRSMIMDSKDLIEVLIKEAEITDREIIIDWHLELVDQYGNDVVRNVLLLGLKPEDAERINWENITTDQFEDLTLYWKHPNIFD